MSLDSVFLIYLDVIQFNSFQRTFVKCRQLASINRPRLLLELLVPSTYLFLTPMNLYTHLIDYSIQYLCRYIDIATNFFVVCKCGYLLF